MSLVSIYAIKLIGYQESLHKYVKFKIFVVNEKEKINWDVVNRYKTIASVSPNEKLVVKESEYDLALVTPNYRASNVYIVTQVCEYLKAESNFPTPDYNSYVDYFQQRHSIQIRNPSQPMLEVKPISSKINFIKPRYSSQDIRLENFTFLKVIIVVHIFNFNVLEV